MREWEIIRIKILLREGMGMFLYTTTGMGWEWECGLVMGGIGIKKAIPAHP